MSEQENKPGVENAAAEEEEVEVRIKNSDKPKEDIKARH